MLYFQTFPAISKLQEHRQLHRRSRPFVCCLCQEQYRSRSSLRRHQLREVSNRSFLCLLCAWKFQNLRNLHHHIVSTHAVELLSKSKLKQNVAQILSDHEQDNCSKEADCVPPRPCDTPADMTENQSSTAEGFCPVQVDSEASPKDSGVEMCSPWNRCSNSSSEHPSDNSPASENGDIVAGWRKPKYAINMLPVDITTQLKPVDECQVQGIVHPPAMMDITEQSKSDKCTSKEEKCSMETKMCDIHVSPDCKLLNSVENENERCYELERDKCPEVELGAEDGDDEESVVNEEWSQDGKEMVSPSYDPFIFNPESTSKVEHSVVMRDSPQLPDLQLEMDSDARATQDDDSNYGDLPCLESEVNALQQSLGLYTTPSKDDLTNGLTISKGLVDNTSEPNSQKDNFLNNLNERSDHSQSPAEPTEQPLRDIVNQAQMAKFNDAFLQFVDKVRKRNTKIVKTESKPQKASPKKTTWSQQKIRKEQNEQAKKKRRKLDLIGSTDKNDIDVLQSRLQSDNDHGLASDVRRGRGRPRKPRGKGCKGKAYSKSSNTDMSDYKPPSSMSALAGPSQRKRKHLTLYEDTFSTGSDSMSDDSSDDERLLLSLRRRRSETKNSTTGDVYNLRQQLPPLRHHDQCDRSMTDQQPSLEQPSLKSVTIRSIAQNLLRNHREITELRTQVLHLLDVLFPKLQHSKLITPESPTFDVYLNQVIDAAHGRSSSGLKVLTNTVGDISDDEADSPVLEYRCKVLVCSAPDRCISHLRQKVLRLFEACFPDLDNAGFFKQFDTNTNDTEQLLEEVLRANS